jgi:beta-glucosidase
MHIRTLAVSGGVDHYFRQIVADDPDGPAPHFRQLEVPGATTTGHADELEQILLRLCRDYGVERLYVPENGSAWADLVTANGTVDERERTAYLESHLAAYVDFDTRARTVKDSGHRFAELIGESKGARV